MTMWVFGYGSLLWNPGFEVDAQQVGVMQGYARSFCMRSIHHRGTSEHPGLVLALDETKDARCKGVALRVKAGAEPETLAYLRERELISSAYLENNLDVHLSSGEVIRINTGAPVPPGADSVVMVENTKLVRASEDGEEEIEVEILTGVSVGQVWRHCH